MKVKEIITESYVEEGIGRWLFGKPMSYITNIIRNSTSKKQVIQALASLADNKGKIDITNPAAAAAISRFGNGIIRQAEKLAKDLKFKNDLALLKGKVAPITGLSKKIIPLVKSIPTALTYVGFGTTITKYVSEMSQAIEQVENGSMTPAEFDKFRSERTSKVITDLALQLGAVIGVRASSSALGWAGTKVEKVLTLGGIFKLPGVSSLSKLKSASSSIAQAYFVNKISSPDATTAVATMLLEPILSVVYTISDNASSIPGYEYFKQKVDDAKKLIDGIAGDAISSISSAAGSQSPSTVTQPTTSATADVKPSKYVSSTTPMTSDERAALTKSVLQKP